jgi:phosphoenolpyruvate phosphomutase
MTQDQKSKRFRSLLWSQELTFVMEAHNGLSAKIVEEAGFECIWASGLSIATSLGLRDCNEASWTQIVDMVEFMADATSIPIMVDGDSGGHFNTVRRLIRKLSHRGVAALCLEDKVAPKRNSFLEGPQNLASIPEFCGKIRAAKDNQVHDSFCVIARTEAFIAGSGLSEAVERAEAYVAAGADGVLIHSKRQNADEIIRFMSRWQMQAPIVIVPTSYAAVPASLFRALKISMVIWANHNLRASINAMRSVSRQIARDESPQGLDDAIATLNEVFALVDTDELMKAERRYGFHSVEAKSE